MQAAKQTAPDLWGIQHMASGTLAFVFYQCRQVIAPNLLCIPALQPAACNFIRHSQLCQQGCQSSLAALRKTVHADWQAQALKYAALLCEQLGVSDTVRCGMQAELHKAVLIHHQDQYEAIETHNSAAGTFATLVILHGAVKSGLPLAQCCNATCLVLVWCNPLPVQCNQLGNTRLLLMYNALSALTSALPTVVSSLFIAAHDTP